MLSNAQVDKSKCSFDSYYLAALIALSVRFVQGWIFWAGGSRRFIYASYKIDPDSHGYLAYKLMHGAAGAVPFIGSIIYWLSTHATLLHFSIIIFSAVELICGAALVLGFFTRFFALISVGLNFFLMIVFGWLGATCIDEWTMASAGFAMGITVFLAGGEAFSLDSIMMRRKFKLTQNKYFPWIGSGKIYMSNKLATTLGILSLVFTVGFYNYFVGGVYSPMHHRVSAKEHNIAITYAKLSPNGNLQFKGFVNAGPDTQALYIIGAKVISNSGEIVESWTGRELNNKNVKINNLYHYAPAGFSAYGISAPLATKTIYQFHGNLEQPLSVSNTTNLTLELDTISGKKFKSPVSFQRS